MNAVNGKRKPILFSNGSCSSSTAAMLLGSLLQQRCLPGSCQNWTWPGSECQSNATLSTVTRLPGPRCLWQGSKLWR